MEYIPYERYNYLIDTAACNRPTTIQYLLLSLVPRLPSPGYEKRATTEESMVLVVDLGPTTQTG